MVTKRILATPVINDAVAANASGNIGVALYHAGSPTLPGLGNHLRESARRYLPVPPDALTWDFLSIALAVFAADRFILRDEAQDGWTRVIPLTVAVSNPAPWMPHLPRLEAALRFLTGDIWQILLRGGGASPPTFSPRKTDRDVVSLFSGGLDSLLGALRLLDEGRKPFLVSQGSPKEVGPQINLAKAIGLEQHRFDGRVNERWRPPYEGSTRGRSLIFFAYGVLAASSHKLPEVIVPENGLIAINPPFTPRRMGSLSTRTTHPHFLGELESILQDVGINVRLVNIFEGMTKGEMMKACKHPHLVKLGAASYSCGKGKRWNGQCGRCVPCLIRRAAFNASGVPDNSVYFADLARSTQNDDVMAARIAAARVRGFSATQVARWAAKSGPLPADAVRRQRITDTVRRGLIEMDSFLNQVAWH